jgi:hypothetical protein
VQISPAGPAWLARVAGLTQLELARCVKLTDASVRHLSDLEALRHLGLAGCEQITGAGFDAFLGSTCLQVRAAGCCSTWLLRCLAHCSGARLCGALRLLEPAASGA